MAIHLPYGNHQISSVHPALELFDRLPDSSYVPIAVICGIYSCSTATIWRRVKSGEIVRPVKLGKRTTRWQVGMVRKALKQATSDQHVQGGKE